MDHSIIPNAWKEVLAKLQILAPSALMAGGCLRDTICEVPVKDVDIFINDNEYCRLEELASLFNVEAIPHGGEIGKRDYVKLEHDFKNQKNKSAAKYRKVDPRYINQETHGINAVLQSYITYIYDMMYQGMMYQIIFVEAEPKKFIDFDFDFGLCKVTFDGVKLNVTDEFWYDYENRQLTITGSHSAAQMIHTLFTHRANLAKKYPNWPVVVGDIRLRTDEEMPPSYQQIKKNYVEPEVQVSFPADTDDGADVNPWAAQGTDPDAGPPVNIPWAATGASSFPMQPVVVMDQSGSVDLPSNSQPTIQISMEEWRRLQEQILDYKEDLHEAYRQQKLWIGDYDEDDGHKFPKFK